jgi:hypothetical protein
MVVLLIDIAIVVPGKIDLLGIIEGRLYVSGIIREVPSRDKKRRDLGGARWV